MAKKNAFLSLLQQWLEPVAALPLDTERHVQAISSLLAKQDIGHQAVKGWVKIPGVGELTRHLWVELNDGTCIDFQARPLLNGHPGVPCGVFKPQQSIYDACLFFDAALSPTAFLTLIGKPVSSFPMPHEIQMILPAKMTCFAL